MQYSTDSWIATVGLLLSPNSALAMSLLCHVLGLVLVLESLLIGRVALVLVNNSADQELCQSIDPAGRSLPRPPVIGSRSPAGHELGVWLWFVTTQTQVLWKLVFEVSSKHQKGASLICPLLWTHIHDRASLTASGGFATYQLHCQWCFSHCNCATPYAHFSSLTLYNCGRSRWWMTPHKLQQTRLTFEKLGMMKYKGRCLLKKSLCLLSVREAAVNI